MLIGLGKVVKKIAGGISLLASKVLGFTYSGGGGSSYYTTRVESTVQALIGGAYNSIFKSINNGKNWEVLPSDMTISSTVNAFGKIYATAGQGFLSTDKFSNFISDWTYVSLPNSSGYTYTVHGKKVLTYTLNGNTTLEYYGSKYNYDTDLIENKRWTTIDGITWQEEILPMTSTIDVIATNNRIYIIEDLGNYAFKVYSKGETSWSSQQYAGSRFQNDTRTFVDGQNLYLYYSATNNDKIIAKLDIDCSEISSDIITPITVNDNNYTPIEIFVAPNGELTFLTYISSGDDNSYIYKSTDKNISWSVSTINNFDVNFVKYIKSENMILSIGRTRPISGGQSSDKAAYSLDLGTTWTITSTVLNGLQYVNPFPGDPSPVTITTMVETQISIGNQGSEGAEILAPVVVYQNIEGQYPTISYIEVENTSGNQASIDLWVISDSNPIANDSNPGAIVLDQIIAANSTQTISNVGQLYGTQRIVALPSTVDVITVRVYGQ